MTTIYEALAAVMNDVQAVKKAERNTAQNFNFRGIDAVLNAVGPALREHKVIVSPKVDSVEASTVEVGGNRTRMGHVRVLVTYTFFGPEGDSFPAQAPGEAMDSGDKATAKAMSVAYRTALLQAFALPTDEPDPDHAVYERAPAAPAVTLDELMLRAEQAQNTEALDAVARAAVAAQLSPTDLDLVKGVVKAQREALSSTPAAA